MPLGEPTRRLAAILCADIVGYSRLMAEDQDATVALANECRASVSDLVARHAGRVVDAVGDNILAEFPTATAAASCAVAVQAALAARDAERSVAQRLQLRIGIDLGEIRVEEGRIYGDGVNVAARLQALAEPGSVYVSGPVREQIRGTLKLRCEDLGERSVKNIPHPVRVHRVLGETEAPSPAAPRGVRSLAVLPFVDMDGNPSSEAFADGLAEEILNLLARLGELRVAARTSSFSFKKRDADIREIARLLGVKHVLEGSVRRDGERIRVTAQLIDGESGFHVWSETYDRGLHGIFAIQDEISRHVVRELKLVLSREAEGKLASPRPASPEAYECALQGRAYMNRPNETALESAVRLFTRALELDPDYAPAHAGLCRAHLARFRGTRAADAFAQAKQAGERAIALDGSSAEARVALGSLYLHSGRLDEALATLELAVATDPFSADARQALAEVYARQGRSDDALRGFHEAIDLQPGNWLARQTLGSFLFSLGRFKEAEEEFRRVVELTPDNAGGHANLGAVFYMTGDLERAAECFQRAQQIAPTALTCNNLGSVYFLLRRFEDAVRVLERAVELAPDDHRPRGALADALRQVAGRDGDAQRCTAEAIRLAEQTLSVDPADAEALALLGHYCAEAGDAARARESAARALELAPLDPQLHFFAAYTLARLADLDAAQAALERAVELGYPSKLFASDVLLAPLWERPRFKQWSSG